MANYLSRNSSLLILVAALSLAATAATWILVGQLNGMNWWVEHTLEVIEEGQQALTCLMDCETAYRGYLISPNKEFLEPYEHCYRNVGKHLDRIKELTVDSPAQQALIPVLEQLAIDKIKFTQRAISVREAASAKVPASDLIDLKPGKAIMDKFRAAIGQLIDNEESLLRERKRSVEDLRALVAFSVLALTLAVVGLLIMVVTAMQAYVKQQALQQDALQALIAARTKDLAASEQKMRVLFDVMPQLGWTAQMDGFVDFYNQGWYDYTGKTYDELKGWGWEQVVDLEALPQVQERWKHSIATGNSFEMKFPLRRHDGTSRWFLTRMRPVFDENAKCVRWVGINTDIDEERQAAEVLEQRVQERTIELKGARDEAVRANELKSQFVANITHEIRTPMSGILGLTELLRLETEGQAKETADHIMSSAENLMQLVNDLLDFSKLEAGKIEITRQTFQIDQVIGEVLATFKSSAAKKNLRLSAHVDEAVLGDVFGDCNRIRQVLLNLVQNAIKFTEAGAIDVSAELEREERHVKHVKFSVRDTGVGISAENQKKLFQLFVQVDGSTTRRHGGTGLGLALCKKMVELMDGSIGVKSAEQAGSTFWFTLPLLRGNSL